MTIVIKDLFVKKQPSIICTPWKEISGETNLNHKNPSKFTLNIQTSKRPQNNNIGTLDKDSSDQKKKNSKELPTPLNPPKQQRKQVASMNADFLWI